MNIQKADLCNLVLNKYVEKNRIRNICMYIYVYIVIICTEYSDILNNISECDQTRSSNTSLKNGSSFPLRQASKLFSLAIRTS